MEKIIYIVHGPFQLFNCCEAKNRFHANDHNILIFIDRGDHRNRAQTLQILEDETFDEFHHIPFQSFPDKHFYPQRNRALLHAISHPKKLYVSLYRNLSSHIINTTRPDEVIIYDDGNRTLNASLRIFEKNQAKAFKPRAALASLVGRKLDLSFTRKAKFFSLYDLPIVPKKQYIKNDYSYYKSLIGNLPTSDHVDFIGSKFIGYGIDEATFEESMQNVVRFYRQQGKTLRYITHRYEPLDYLNRVAKEVGFELINLPSIIEVAYSQANALPSEIATLRTAAVSNLNTIFGLPVRIFEIPPKRLEANTRDNLQLIYQNFKDQGFATEPAIQ